MTDADHAAELSAGTRRRARALVGLALAAGSMLGGCGLREPAFELEAVRVAEQTGDGVALEFDLLLTNRNREPLPLEDLAYSVWLGDEQVFSGARPALLTLPAGESAVLTVPAPVPIDRWRAIAGGPGQVRARVGGWVSYVEARPIPRALYDADLRRPRAEFSLGGPLGSLAPAFGPDLPDTP